MGPGESHFLEVGLRDCCRRGQYGKPFEGIGGQPWFPPAESWKRGSDLSEYYTGRATRPLYGEFALQLAA